MIESFLRPVLDVTRRAGSIAAVKIGPSFLIWKIFQIFILSTFFNLEKNWDFVNTFENPSVVIMSFSCFLQNWSQILCWLKHHIAFKVSQSSKKHDVFSQNKIWDQYWRKQETLMNLTEWIFENIHKFSFCFRFKEYYFVPKNKEYLDWHSSQCCKSTVLVRRITAS